MAWYDCGPNSVAWSDIGHNDFTPKADDNVAGYMHMPWDGEVVCVKRLGDVVMVYGTGGMAALFPVIEPEPTFGRKDLKGGSVPYRDCVCGDHMDHYFIDQIGNLWHIDSGLKVTELGYKEFLGALDLSKTIMNYERVQQEVFISDGVKSFLKTRWGMSQTYLAVTSVYAVEGELLGHAYELDDTNFALKTNIVDLGVRGLKNIAVVELGVSQDVGEVSEIEVSADWRVRKTDDWKVSPWIRANDQGVVTLAVSGAEFRFNIRCVNPDLDLDYLTVRYNLVDKRYIRGMYNAG